MICHTAAGSRRRVMTLLALIALAGFAAITPVARSGAAQSTPVSATPAAGETIELMGLVQDPGPISVGDLQALPSETVEVTYESGGAPEDHTITWVRLYDVLEHVGIAADPAIHHPLLSRSLIVTANDGYQIVLSGGELDPAFGNAPMLLAWSRMARHS
jgi:hypothetical protein